MFVNLPDGKVGDAELCWASTNQCPDSTADADAYTILPSNRTHRTGPSNGDGSCASKGGRLPRCSSLASMFQCAKGSAIRGVETNALTQLTSSLTQLASIPGSQSTDADTYKPSNARTTTFLTLFVVSLAWIILTIAVFEIPRHVYGGILPRTAPARPGRPPTILLGRGWTERGMKLNPLGVFFQ